jgi:hypothetical protein
MGDGCSVSDQAAEGRQLLITHHSSLITPFCAVNKIRSIAKLSALLCLLCLAARAAGQATDPASDAPEHPVRSASLKDASSYFRALETWRTPEDVNAWIGARFEYDMSRAMLLSETQRSGGARVSIHEPAAFFAAPSGVCVDLSRFAVETLRRLDAGLNARYLMIEFAPLTVGGDTLRLHWLAAFTRDGRHYFFADSKRAGHLAGPYASTRDFIDHYTAYRGRQIVAFRELDSWQRRERAPASKQARSERP